MDSVTEERLLSRLGPILVTLIYILLALIVAGFGVALLIELDRQLFPVIGALLFFLIAVVFAIPSSLLTRNRWIRIITLLFRFILIILSIIVIIGSLIDLLGRISTAWLEFWPDPADYTVILNEYIWWWLGVFLAILSTILIAVKVSQTARRSFQHVVATIVMTVIVLGMLYGLFFLFRYYRVSVPPLVQVDIYLFAAVFIIVLIALLIEKYRSRQEA
ncbi:hypothetical protein ACFLVP_00930 [Chloroflexota bacterium]